ncbi:phosphatase PAP2 family protein [bacterium]|nr:MAG: phosphatase PAP2 family protein [bacterium]
MNFPVGKFFAQFFAALPELFPLFALAWVFTFVFFIVSVMFLKKHIHPHVLRADAKIRAWARTLRYEDTHATGPHAIERHARTYFFRFWTNFASAPSLIFQSIALAIWATGNTDNPRLYYLPGLSYAGSMLLSFVSKRVFRRARPIREEGAFGHKLKDGSFPSGHSLTCFAFWFMIAVNAVVAHAGAPWIGGLFIAATLIVAFTGLSRIYLGVHFPSDVLGGYSIGLIWCVACYFALHPVL